VDTSIEARTRAAHANHRGRVPPRFQTGNMGPRPARQETHRSQRVADPQSLRWRSMSVPKAFLRAEERAEIRLPPPRSAHTRCRTRRLLLADTMAWHRTRSAPLLI